MTYPVRARRIRRGGVTAPGGEQFTWMTDLEAAGGMYYSIPGIALGGDDFEISGEFWTDDVTGTEYIVSGTATGNNEIVIRINGSNLEFLAYVGTTLQTACSVAFTANELHTFVAKYTGTTASLRINDGTEDTETWALNGSQNIVNIGRNSAGNYFDGIIRNIRIWTGGDRTTGTLARYYRLDESSGIVIFDVASGQNGSTVNITDDERELFLKDGFGDWVNVYWPNLLTRSEEFDNAIWGKFGSPAPTVTANQSVSPIGTLTADRVTWSAGTAVLQQQSLMYTSGQTWTLSFYVKAVSGTQSFRLTAFDGVTPYPSTNKVANSEWQRFSHTFTVGNTTSNGNAAIIRDSINNAADLYIWGAQLEEGSSATPYKKTTDTAGRKIEVA